MWCSLNFFYSWTEAFSVKGTCSSKFWVCPQCAFPHFRLMSENLLIYFILCNLFLPINESTPNRHPIKMLGSAQWRTQKILMGGFIQWQMVVICIWCALFVTSQLMSYSCSQTKFVDIIGIFFYTHSPYFCKKSSPIHSPCNKVFVKYQAQGEG